MTAPDPAQVSPFATRVLEALGPAFRTAAGDLLPALVDGLTVGAADTDALLSLTTAPVGADPAEVRNLILNPRGITPDPTVREARRNLVPNPQPGQIAGWAVNPSGGTAALSYVASGGPVGGFIRATWTVAPTGYGYGVRADSRTGSVIPVAAATTYAGSIYARASVAQNFRCVLYWLAADGSVLGQVAGPIVSAPAGQWTPLTVTGQAPTGAAIAILSANVDSAPALLPVGGTVDAAAALVEANGLLGGDYFDGDTPATTTIAYTWNGTPNASTTSAYSAHVETRRNLADKEARGVYFSGGNNIAGPADVVYAGRTWQRVTSTAGGQIARMYAPPGVLIDGRAYSIGVLVANDGADPVTFAADWCDGPAQTFTIAPGEVRRVTMLGQSKPTYSNVYRFFDVAPTAAQSSLLLTEPIIEAGTTVGDFFDGDTTDVEPYSYEWTGPASTAASVQRAQAVGGGWSVGEKAKGAVLHRARFEDGTLGVRVTIPAYAPPPTWRVLAVDPGNGVIAAQVPIGEAAQMAVRARASDPAAFTGFLLQGNGTSGTGQSFPLPLGPEWAELAPRSTATTAAGSSALVYVGLWTDSVARLRTVDLAHLGLVPGDSSAGYFDGDTGDPGPYSYAWTGSAHRSASVRRLRDLSRWTDEEGVAFASARFADLSVSPFPAWLAQLVGLHVPAGLTPGDAREYVAGRGASRRGTPAALKAAAAGTLIGARRVDLVERQGSPWRVLLVTYAGETPDPAATVTAVLAEKPVGLVLTHLVATGRVFAVTTAEGLTFAEHTATGRTFADRTRGA